MSNLILGVIDNEEYRKKYTKENRKSKHLTDREKRIELSLDNAMPVHYYEILRKKDSVRQVHCLYEDSTLIVFNKTDGKIITIMLLGRAKLTEYLAVANETLSDRIVMQRCAKVHERLTSKKSGEITDDILKEIKQKKVRYMGGRWY